MIHKYCKKVPIEAEQFDGSEKMVEKYEIYTGIDDWGRWFKISTLEGRDIFSVGDWIATGIDGEHWAIADDIFRRTYERCD